MDPFNISGLDGGKEIEQVKVRIDVTTVITHKATFCGKHIIGDSLPRSRRRGSIKHHRASIMTKKNALVIVLSGNQFRLEMMVPKRSKELSKTSEGIIVTLLVSIQGKQENTKNRGSRNSTMEPASHTN